MRKSSFARLVRYAWRYKWQFVMVVLSALVEVASSIASVIIIGNGIDFIKGIGNVDVTSLVACCVQVAVLTALYVVADWLMEVFSARLTYSVVKDIRKDVFCNIQKVPLGYIDSSRTGELISRMVSDVEQISDGLLLCCSQLISGVLTIVGTIVVMMVIDWRIGLIIVLITPLSLMLASFISKGTHKHFARQSEIRADVSDQVEQYASNPTLFKTFCREEQSVEQFDVTNSQLEDTSVRAVFYSSLPNPTTRFVNNIIYALIGFFGSLTVISSGLLTVGKLTSFLTFALKYAKPFNAVTDVMTEIESALASAEKVFEVATAENETPDGEDAVELTQVDGNVRIDNVCFSYVSDKQVIKNFDLQVASGTNVAIVGKTGCGKTTLINLLMRFYDVDSGRIEVSGYNVNNVTRNSLRSNFGMVLQDSYVFGGTVRYNVAFGRQDATDEEVVTALKNAHAWGFVSKLPQGIDTVVDGCNLSEGQKQLLCIARAMLDLPKMLILDEATSSVDTRTELRIQQAFDEMMQHRTCFVVAHRLSTIMKADKIIVMDDGKIVEQGTHEELLKLNGYYSRLYNSQFAEN